MSTDDRSERPGPFIHMVYPAHDGPDTIAVCMCPRHQEEAERAGWEECNPEWFLADFCEEHQVCERCEDEQEARRTELERSGVFKPGDRLSTPTIRPGRLGFRP